MYKYADKNYSGTDKKKHLLNCSVPAVAAPLSVISLLVGLLKHPYHFSHQIFFQQLLFL